MENHLSKEIIARPFFVFLTNPRGAGAGEDDARIFGRIVVGLAATIDPCRLGNIECSRRGKMVRLAFLEYSLHFSFLVSPHPIVIYVMRQIQIRAESGRGFLVNLLHGLATLIS